MNRTLLIGFLFLSLFATGALAAKSATVPSFNPETAQCKGSRVQLPDGTKFLATRGRSVGFKMPSTHFIAKPNGRFGTSLKLTCTCTQGSGCNPTAAGGSVGCTLTDSCSACSGTKSGVIMEDTGIDFESSKGVSSAMRYDSSMTQLEWLNDELNEFTARIYGQSNPPQPLLSENGKLNAPEGYLWTAIRVYGHQASVLVPEARLGAGMLAAKAFSCSCTSGGSGCTPESDWRGVTWCEAGSCNSCTMDTGSSFTEVTLDAEMENQ